MLGMYRRSKKLYKKRYHRRSLAETVISRVKRKEQKNELRLKMVTYNRLIIARLPAHFG